MRIAKARFNIAVYFWRAKLRFMYNAKAVCFIHFPILFFSLTAIGQIPSVDPKQHYTIQVTLDEIEKTLHGTLKLEWQNPISRPVDTLFFHLWANAFADNKSAYARQVRQFNDVDMFFTPKRKRIRYRSANFFIGDGEVKKMEWNKHRDIVFIPLNRAIQPGDKVWINVTFDIAIPGFHSRLGTDGQIWQMAHWYPRVAKLDEEGWHPLPYLEMGEFYNDFAHYDVQLNLPARYTPVFTGVPSDSLTESQYALALERSKESISGMPETMDGRRTWSVEARWVPDFTWATSEDYLVDTAIFALADGRTCIAQAAYTKERQKAWTMAFQYVKRAVQFYDQHVGPYPWPHAIAVQGVRGFSGGMEYPMLTFIQPNMSGGPLDQVIAHEVGHNWFYGILSSDERRFPWMDEGMNSYYEERYAGVHIKSNAIPIPFDLDQNEIVLKDLAVCNDLPLPADGTGKLRNEIDYFAGAYAIPAKLFDILEQVYGTTAVDNAFNAYYHRWAFDHPKPADARQVFEQSLGKDLGWLFEDGLERPFSRDIGVRAVEKNDDVIRLAIRSKNHNTMPWRLSKHFEDGSANHQWFDAFTGRDTIVEIIREQNLKMVSVRDGLVPDIGSWNDRLWVIGFPSRNQDRRYGFGYGLNMQRPSISFTPIMGYNMHDKFSIGLGIHNQGITYKRFGYYGGAMISVVTGRVNYHGAIHQDFYPNAGPLQWRAALRFASFNYGTEEVEGLHRSYIRWTPSLTWQSSQVQHRGQPHWQAGIHAWFIHHTQKTKSGKTISEDNDFIIAGRIRRTVGDAITPWHVALDVEYQPYKDSIGLLQSYVKTGIESQIGFRIHSKSWFKARIFAGFFPYNSNRNAEQVGDRHARGSLGLGYHSRQDYRFDDVFLDRGKLGAGGIGQVYIREGGFKVLPMPGIDDGLSNDMILALNLWTGMPFRLPALLRPVNLYTDIGYWADARGVNKGGFNQGRFWVDFGVKYNIWGERMAVYFPIWENNQLGAVRDARGNSYWTKVTWTVRFDLVRLPFRVMNLVL